jgi:nucleoside-diphosphate-sugar epimerase
MQVLITGGAGFLGRRLARRLLELGALRDAAGEARPIERVVLLDVVEADGFDDPRVVPLAGDFCDPDCLATALHDGTGAVFHLAAVVSGQAEAEFDLGMRVNLDGSWQLLERCRLLGHRPRVIFTSSVAVYGGALPTVVHDDTALTPSSSYGTQKAVAELLLAEFHRRGFVDGRVLRLPTVSVRPGRPNAAASSFASGVIREPLNGLEAVCPVDPETRLWLLSPRRAIDCLVHGHEVDDGALGDRRAVNLPGVTVTAREMVATLEAIAGHEVATRVRWVPDPAVERSVGSWPGAWATGRAETLGFPGDADFAAIVRAYIEDDLPAAGRG